jgi:hypothetical protein
LEQKVNVLRLILRLAFVAMLAAMGTLYVQIDRESPRTAVGLQVSVDRAQALAWQVASEYGELARCDLLPSTIFDDSVRQLEAWSEVKIDIEPHGNLVSVVATYSKLTRARNETSTVTVTMPVGAQDRPSASVCADIEFALATAPE